jgi:D-xylose transport system permease protein
VSQTSQAAPPPRDDNAVGAVDPRLIVQQRGLRGYSDTFVQRVRSGELGSLPVIVGLIVIWIVFQILNDNFLSPGNLQSLTLQIAGMGTMSVGIVLVLLLGEIDLSVGSVSGVTSAILAVLNVNLGLDPVLSIIAAVVAGGVIGAIHGFFFAKVGVPAFVVTLAGLIGWEGMQLRVLGEKGTINFSYDGLIASLSLKNVPQVVAYLLAAVVVVVFLISSLLSYRRRTAASLPARPIAGTIALTVLLAVGVFGSVIVLDKAGGVPILPVIFVFFVIVMDLVMRKTPYGRKVFAVGGSVEAARRAGINVTAIRISVFAISSTFAAIGGVLMASRLLAVNQSTGASDVLLNVIAAAVIGGTSLFGGRGSIYSALLGMLVIGSITSGMFLLSVGSDVRFMVTAVVLLASVVIDSLSRRGRRQAGRG